MDDPEGRRRAGVTISTTILTFSGDRWELPRQLGGTPGSITDLGTLRDHPGPI